MTVRIGILGAGQLADLLARSAASLGAETLCFAAHDDVPAAKSSALFIGDMTLEADLRAFAKRVDVITLENENIDLTVLAYLLQYVPVYPDQKALYYAQDRLYEKTLFQTLGIPTPRFASIDHAQDIAAAVNTVGLPGILKTRRFGYDGKGQYAINTEEDLTQAVAECHGQSLILEERIHFDAEVSLLAAQNTDGKRVYYPLIQNTHVDGILRYSYCPRARHDLQQQAMAYMDKLLNHLGYCGLLALELFVCDGMLLANEMAPRVHNSGHLTLEAFDSSQFQSHIRAILGQPMHAPKQISEAMMLNIIGEQPCALLNAAREGINVYHYGKKARPGRKLGHITIKAQDNQTTRRLLACVEEVVGRVGVEPTTNGLKVRCSTN